MPAANVLSKWLIISRSTIQPNGCWKWNGPLSRKGYGTLAYKNGQHRAHRLSLHVFKGFDYMSKLVVRHNCHNPWCVNPDHLIEGTPYENTMDSIRDGKWGYRGGEVNGNSKLTQRQADTIRKLFSEHGVSIEDLSILCALHTYNVRRIIRNKSYLGKQQKRETT